MLVVIGKEEKPAAAEKSIAVTNVEKFIFRQITTTTVLGNIYLNLEVIFL